MAKNKKATKKQRKLEAKQRRLEELRRRARRQQMRRVYTIAGVAVVIGGIVAAVLAGGSSGRSATKRLNTLAAAAGCGNVEKPNLLPAGHIAPPARATYNSDPPTSGQHYNAPGLGPVPTGVYQQQIQDEGQVHNLEHGHVGIQYTPALPGAVRSSLESFVKEPANQPWVLTAPRASMQGGQLAFTAWGVLLKCSAPTDGAKVVELAREFVKQFRDKGPESVPGSPAGTTPVTPPSPAATSGATPTATTTARATASPS